MSAVINISFRRPTCLATLGLPSKADSEIKFLDQDFQRQLGGAWGPALYNDWVRGRKQRGGQRGGQRPRPGTATSVSSHVTNPFQTLHVLKIDLLLNKSTK